MAIELQAGGSTIVPHDVFKELAALLTLWRERGGMRSASDNAQLESELTPIRQAWRYLFGANASLPSWFRDRLPTETPIPDAEERQRLRKEFPFLGSPRVRGCLARLGKFDVLRLLGTGGMGVSFEARQDGKSPGESFVLKTIRPDLRRRHPEIDERFEREAQILKQLCDRRKRSPGSRHVVQFISHEPNLCGTDPPLPGIAMEFVCGPTLADLAGAFSGGLFPRELAVDLGLQIARGIRFAHTCKPAVVHRDLAPANVFLRWSSPSAFPNGWEAKVGDFGLAKALGGQDISSPGTEAGRERYWSPAHRTGISTVTECDDVFSFGIILYEMLTGRHPFVHDPSKPTTYHRCFALAREPRSCDSTMPPRLNDLVIAMLSAGARPTLDSVIADLEAELDEMYSVTYRRTDGNREAKPIGAKESPKGATPQANDDLAPQDRADVVRDIGESLDALDETVRVKIASAVQDQLNRDFPDINLERVDFETGLSEAIVDHCQPETLVAALSAVMSSRRRWDVDTKDSVRNIVLRFVPWKLARAVTAGEVGTNAASPVFDVAATKAIAELSVAASCKSAAAFLYAARSDNLKGMLAVVWTSPPTFGTKRGSPSGDPVVQSAISLVRQALTVTQTPVALGREVNPKDAKVVSHRIRYSDSDFDDLAELLESTLVPRKDLNRPRYCVMKLPTTSTAERAFALQVLSLITEKVPDLQFVELLDRMPDPQNKKRLVEQLFQLLALLEEDPDA